MNIERPLAKTGFIRRLALPKLCTLERVTSAAMVVIFAIEMTILVMRFALPPMPAVAETFVNILLISISSVLTLYLFLFRSWMKHGSKKTG